MQTLTEPILADLTIAASRLSLEEQMAYLRGFSMDNILAEINRRKEIQDRKSFLLKQIDELEKEEKGIIK